MAAMISVLVYATKREPQPVAVSMLANVDYVNGSGSFFGFVTFTFSDGSTMGTRMQGLAIAAADGSVTTFSSTLGVVGGTGRYVNTTGSGTFVGERRTALGGDVTATFDLAAHDQRQLMQIRRVSTRVPRQHSSRRARSSRSVSGGVERGAPRRSRPSRSA